VWINIFHKTIIVFALLVPLAGHGANSGQKGDRTPAVTTPRFDFYNDFDTNLNDTLRAAGVARKFGKPELFQSGPEESCFSGLPPSARAGWNRAVDYYAEIISPARFDDRQQFLIRMDLAGFEEGPGDASARQYLKIAAGFRSAATPAYEACRWAAQDIKNQHWMEEINTQLDTHGQAIARRLEALYQKPWSSLPIPVDVVETVSWSGANTIFVDSARGHILVSNSYRGHAALEIVFHEASHLLMARGDPVQQSLAVAAETLELPLPDDLWHVVMFYMTGEAVRRRLGETGEQEYTPMVYEIYERSSWGRFRDAIELNWPGYMDGERSLSQAAIDLIRETGEPD
jgi:hypothetical protein